MIAALRVHRAIVLGKYQKTKGFLISSGDQKRILGRKGLRKNCNILNH